MQKKSIFYISKIKNYFFKYIFIQSAIYLFCLPVYISHDIPFYMLSFLGNMLFLPFLIIYIMFSLLIVIFAWSSFFSGIFLALQNFIFNIWYFVMEYISAILPECKIVFINNCYQLIYLFCWGFLFLLFILKYYISNNQKTLASISFLFFLLSLFLLTQIPEKTYPIIYYYRNMYYIIIKLHGKNTIHIECINKNGNFIKKKNYSFMVQKKIKELLYKHYKLKDNFLIL